MGLTYQVLADFSGTALGGTPTWTDISSYVLTMPPGQPLTVTDGRQDETSDVNPSVLTFTLDNRDGRFTPGNASSPYYPNVVDGARLRFGVSVNGGTVIPYVDALADSWVAHIGPDRAFGLCDVSATDVLGRFGVSTPLQSIVVEDMLATSPYAYAPLTDPAGTVSPQWLVFPASAGRAVFGNTAASYSFGATGVPADTSGAVEFVDFSTTAGYAIGLEPSGLVLGATAVSAGVWFANSLTAQVGLPLTLTTQGGDTMGVQLFLSAGVCKARGFAGAGVTSSATVVFGPSTTDPSLMAWHHLGFTVTVASGTATLTAYLDGVSLGSTTGAVSNTTVANITAGGQIAYLTSAQASMTSGMYAHLGIWTGAAPTWANLFSAGSAGYAGESTFAHVQRLLSYRPGATAVSQGTYSKNVGLHDTSGVTLQQALFDTAHVEGAPLYVDGQGRVILMTQSSVTSPTTAATLDGSAGQMQMDVQQRVDNQYVVNRFDATCQQTGNTQTAVSSSSATRRGYYEQAVTAPYANDTDAATAASLMVSSLAAPSPGVPQVPVDLFALVRNSPTLVSTLLGVRTGGVLALSNVKSPLVASSTVMVLGRSLSVDLESCMVTFFTGPSAAGVSIGPTGGAGP